MSPPYAPHGAAFAILGIAVAVLALCGVVMMHYGAAAGDIQGAKHWGMGLGNLCSGGPGLVKYMYMYIYICDHCLLWVRWLIDWRLLPTRKYIPIAV